MQTIGDAYVIVSGLPYVDMSLHDADDDNLQTLWSSPDQASLREARRMALSDSPGTSMHRKIEKPNPKDHIRDLIKMASDMHKEVRKVRTS